jgi:hypothetical protein
VDAVDTACGDLIARKAIKGYYFVAPEDLHHDFPPR